MKQGRVCQHRKAEGVSNDNITASRIKELIDGAKMPHKNGKVTWWIGNYSNDLDKTEQVVTFKDIFRHYEFENYPLRYDSVKTKEEADIKIYFVNDKGMVESPTEKPFKCPVQLDDQTLAVAYAPYNGKWQGYVFINDSLFWTLKHGAVGDKHNLYTTLLHEIGHTFNLDHSTNPRDIMYYMEQEDQEWLDDSIGLLFDIYKDDRVAALKKVKSGMLLVDYYNSKNKISAKQERDQSNLKFSYLIILATLIATAIVIAVLKLTL